MSRRVLAAGGCSQAPGVARLLHGWQPLVKLPAAAPHQRRPHTCTPSRWCGRNHCTSMSSTLTALPPDPGGGSHSTSGSTPGGSSTAGAGGGAWGAAGPGARGRRMVGVTACHLPPPHGLNCLRASSLRRRSWRRAAAAGGGGVAANQV